MLEGNDIQVHIDGATLLKDVSVRIIPGEVVAILGPNGAGKSTLLKVLCGDLSPTSGAVSMDGKHLSEWDRRACAQRRAVLPQQASLNFPFTVLDVALMGRSPHHRGIESAADYAITRAALREAGVDDIENRLYTTLSGGERQRVHLGRVLTQIWQASYGLPRYLLLDEPTANLDLAHQHRILAVARRFATQNVGVVVVLHDLNLAAQYADRMLLLNAGQLIATGAPAQVLQEDIIESVYGITISVIPHPHVHAPLVVPLAS